MKAEFAPVRWWQAIDFIRLSLKMLRGHDVWADRILSQPWAPSSLLEYVYILAKFPFSDVYFFVVSGKRVGALWMIRQAELLYVLSLGLIPDFRLGNVGMGVARLLIQTEKFIEDHARQHKIQVLVLRMAGDNTASQRMARVFGCRPLGLATTTLKISPTDPPDSPLSGTIEVGPLKKSEAAKAWKRWKLYYVERVAGCSGVEVASRFVESFYWVDMLPQGKYLVLRQDDQEIGFAFACECEGGLELGLLADARFFSEDRTAVLIDILTSHLQSPVRYLTVALEHADALIKSAPSKYERNRHEERLTMFQLAACRPTLAPHLEPDGILTSDHAMPEGE